MIEVEGLTKYYGPHPAIMDVSFTVKAGEVVAFLGPNGAGKTTTMSILSCLARPSAGDAWIMGHHVQREAREVKRSIGVVPQDIALYADLSARENLLFWGRMQGMGGAALRRRAREVMEIIGLSDRAGGRVETFSGGMKRRVNIGVALMHTPQVLILDEPTVGIDPQSRRHILDNVKELNQQGMTVLYTTHYMEEAAELSHHIAIMDKGKVIAYGTHAELIKMVGELTRIDISINAESEKVLAEWQKTEGVASIDAADGKITVLADDSNRILPRLFEAASRAGVHITSVDIREPNLEMVFLHLTGRALRD
jgi:ABC-2 type transport system ATP-binding protein